MSTLSELWHGVLGTQPAPPIWLVLATGVAGLTASVHRRTWQVCRGVITIAHEGGHALVAVSTGRRLRGIRLHSDTSGVTVSKGKPTGTGMIVTAAAGYVTPSLLGVGAALLLAAGHITAMLWIVIAALGAILVVVRNAYGVVSVVCTGGAVFAVSWFAPAAVQAVFAYLVAWFLLLAGVRPVIELQRKRRRGRAPNSDADQLARLTGIPGIVWIGVFAVIGAAAIVVGAGWLVPVAQLTFPA